MKHSWKVPGLRSASIEQVSKLWFCTVYYLISFLHIGISNFLPLPLLQTPTWLKQSCRMLLCCGYLCCSTAWWLVVPSDSSAMAWTCRPFWGPCTPSALAVLCRYELITRNLIPRPHVAFITWSMKSYMFLLQVTGAIWGLRMRPDSSTNYKIPDPPKFVQLFHNRNCFINPKDKTQTTYNQFLIVVVEYNI